ncbi:MAG TPA: hypothetical protein VLX92_34380 [Kofleriaceae bacterium]|nr:hypothetical protein [Kofleriaceae bacterium]
MVKLLVGLLKGAVIGVGLGYGAFALAQSTGFDNAWLTYGLIGALVGLFVGRPLWSLLRDKNSTTVVALLKAAFGFGVGCGLYALIAKAWGPSPLNVSIGDNNVNLWSWTPSLGGAIGAVYGAFVEIDDSIGDDKAREQAAKDKAEAKPLPKKK